MPHNVFISYASQDRAVADAACASLEAGGVRCWIAPRDVVPGEDYPSALVRAIGESKALVLILSSHSNGSSQVARELERAASRSVPILPLRIEDVAPSPSVEFFISRTHWLDALTPPLETHLERLVGTVRALISGAGRPGTTPRSAEQPEIEAAVQREVRYCTTDGVRIAYCVEGDGPTLVVLPWFVESFSLIHLVPGYPAFIRRLGEGRRVVRFDIRGTGLSQRDVDDLSLDAILGDAEAVVAAAGSKQFALVGLGASVRGAIAYAVRHPRQVTHLILFGGSPNPPGRDTVLRTLAELVRQNWPFAAQAMADRRDRQRTPETNARVAELWTHSASGETVARLMLANIEIDVTALLPRVKAKTLVLHVLHDEVVPVTVAQEMAAAIPRARLITLPDAGTEDPYIGPHISDVIRAFLASDTDTSRSGVAASRPATDGQG